MGAQAHGRAVTVYVRVLTRHYRKLFLVALSVIIALTAVSVGQYKFLVQQSEQSDYDWTVSESVQSLNRDALEWARANRGLSAKKAGGLTDNVGDVKAERTQTRDFLTLIYQHEQLNSTADIITAGNLKTICEAENVLLNHPDYPKVCYKGASALGYTQSADGRRCAKQQLSIATIYYQAWSDDASIYDKDSADYLFADSSKAELAFMQIFLGVPVIHGKPKAAPGADAELFRGHRRVCDELPAEYVKDRTKQLIKLLDHSDDARQIIGFFLSADVEKQERTELTRSNLVVSGGPLTGYDSKDDRKDEQQEVYDVLYERMELDFWEYFGLVNSNLKSAYASRKPIVNGIAGSPAVDRGVDIRYLGPWAQSEFDRIVNADLMWVFGSVLFVYMYILFHTQSAWLASMGMLQIFLSLPIAFFVYRVIGQIDYFVQLHILTIYLVLGVGADNVFCFCDAYKQAKVMPALATQLQRMLWTWSHSAQAVLNTSVTTAIAFCATAITPVMPISSFGIYAAIAIVMNYVLTITFFPLVVHMYENDVTTCWAVLRRQPHPELVPMGLDEPEPPAEPNGTAVQPLPVPDEGAVAAKHAALASDGVDLTSDVPSNLPYATPGEKLRPAERFFRQYYAPMLNWAPTKHAWLKPVSIGLVCFWATLGGVGARFAFKLRPPTKQEQWFTADHMYTGFGDISSNRFLSGAEDSYVDMQIVLGVAGFERSDNFVVWNPSKNRGKATFDASFDIRERDGQEALRELCDAMRDVPCTVKSCVGGFVRFIRPGELYCPIEEFDEWYGDTVYNATGAKTSSYNGKKDRPTGDSFIDLVKDFTRTSYDTASSFGFISGELAWVEVPFSSTLLNEQPFSTTIAFYDAVHDALARAKADVDPKRLLGERPFVYAGNSFTWIMTEQALVANVLQGFAICFPVCFAILVVATGSPLISLYAIVTIALIVGLTLGFCQAIMGWGLGVAETVCSTIVIGFSVDYVVHLGHSYRESAHFSREGKVSDALTRMGITVVAGAMTTFGSGLFMFGCQMTFFTKMATLIVVVVVCAILYALMFFMPLCAIAGPQGEMKTIAGYAQELASWRRGEPHAAPRPLQAVPAPSSPGAQNSAPSTASTVSS